MFAKQYVKREMLVTSWQKVFSKKYKDEEEKGKENKKNLIFDFKE